MNEEKNLLSAAEADKLLACADGAAALLYLHLLRTGSFSLTAAAAVLKRSEAEVALAADTLRRLGLMEAFRTQDRLPVRETPEYTAEDIVRRANSDRTFTAVVAEAERTLGRVLNTNDLRLLFGIYDHLGLPGDVIMLLLHHCVETYQAGNGAGRMPTMRYIEKEAWHWVEQEIVTQDAAEEHFRLEKRRRETSEQVKEVLQIRNRELTATERKYVEDWLELGYDPETLTIAYDRTVTSTGKLVWKYMDAIIRSWSAKGLYTPEAIESGDARRTGGTSRAAEKSAAEMDSGKLARMREVLDHMKNKEG